MNIVCSDLEGVLVPEIWVEFAHAANIPELELTTREVPDFDELMRRRLEALNKHGMGLKEIQEVAAGIEPFDGAREFLDAVRETTQIVIVSDTFEQLCQPLMRKLGWPTIMCNTLEVDKAGRVTGYRMRCTPSKLTTVNALHTCGFETIAFGDSYNDLQMIAASKAGFLFRSAPEIRAAHPEIRAIDDYDGLLQAIKAAL